MVVWCPFTSVIVSRFRGLWYMADSVDDMIHGIGVTTAVFAE